VSLRERHFIHFISLWLGRKTAGRLWIRVAAAAHPLLSFNFTGAHSCAFYQFFIWLVRVPIIAECGLCDFNRAVLICVKAKALGALAERCKLPPTLLPPKLFLF